MNRAGLRWRRTSIKAGSISADPASITQVLVFRFREQHASFRASHPTLSASAAALARLHPRIQAKVQDYQDSYLSSIANLG